ncbi:MAG TPA: 3-phosphoshikimate 1-carboxyvinyltransferase [Flavobacteriales bacterium]|nr:3-phosphoshikimate 1-carboxyvinyltransferase [Flavobacteriales bacterium]
MNVKLTYCDFPQGEIEPVSSKSISNRALIIHGLTGGKCKLHNLSQSEDTQTLVSLLEKWQSNEHALELDTGPAGTVMRFMTTYCALADREIVLTGNQRMQQRPMNALVDALVSLGAKIEYIDRTGFAPLRILPANVHGGKIKLRANVSSQFISSLLLCAPYFTNGLELELVGPVVSGSYIGLTVQVMKEFGVDVQWIGNFLKVNPGKYIPREYSVEGDWSSASYFFAWAALSKKAHIALNGLNLLSLQGDRAIVHASEKFGVKTVSTPNGIIIEKAGKPLLARYEMDFNDCPDIAQTLAVMCAGERLKEVKLTGLQTLSLKETDRIAALKTEFDRFSIVTKVDGPYSLEFDASGFEVYKGLIHTYDDHRMALSFAPMVQKTGELIIQNAAVVKKSYINYWQDLNSLGCIVENFDI